MTGLVGKSFFKDLGLFITVFIIFNLLETKDVWAASQIIAEVKEKAANVIEHYKPIVYILGGFGLVCVAWGAIFGKRLGLCGMGCNFRQNELEMVCQFGNRFVLGCLDGKINRLFHS